MTKYLSDGRKVTVIGKLNNEESIVQEIFVTESGDEIPSGERFVTKSLHDAPVESCKLREEKNLLKRIARLEDQERGIEAEIKARNNRLWALKDILKSTERLIALIPDAELEVFCQFLTGTCKYLVIDSYTLTKPVQMIDEIIRWDSWNGERKYEGIKLLSVLGKSGGDLEYRIHQYYDGSGSSDACYPFTTYDDAISHIKVKCSESIKKGNLSQTDYDLCTSMGIVFDKEIVDIFEKFQKEKILKNISKIEAEITDKTSTLSELNDKLRAIREPK